MEFSTGLNSLKSYLTMNNGEMLFRQFYSGYSPCSRCAYCVSSKRREDSGGDPRVFFEIFMLYY
jgi:hypothetical protein